MPPQLPKNIGRYEILNVLGRGGMGVLYRARDTTLERDVALKMMLIDFSFDQSAKERFEREAKAVARLQHHNVVTIHELGQNDGTPYIVMELLSGRDLEAVMHSGEVIPLPNKLEIVAQLCDGLAYAHEQGIVHRDIKPGNVRVLEDGTVKILDFGIAKFAQSSMTQSGAIMGTASYMAPEQILGNPVDGRADLFSVGVLLHELLAGEKPFPGESPTAVVYQIVHGEAKPVADMVPDLPRELHDIVDRALKKDPNERYARASDMASDLRLVKMMLDLPLAPATSTISPTSSFPQPKLHATGVVRKPTGSTTRIGGVTPPATAAPELPPAPEPQKSKMGLIAVAVGAVVLLAGGAYFALGGGSGSSEPDPTASPVATSTPAPGPGRGTGTAATTQPTGDSVMVSSVPPGAKIVLNGVDTGRVTPSAVALPRDPSTVELSLKGHQNASGTLTASDLKRGRREFKLAREAQPVKVTVSGPFQFEIRQGDQVLSPLAAHHEVLVSAAGGPVTAFNSDYLLNEALAVDFAKPEFQANIRPLGELAVYASAETCSIVVDGRDLGFPPIARKPIASGPHTVTLKCPDGKEDSRKITIKPADFLPVTFR